MNLERIPGKVRPNIYAVRAGEKNEQNSRNKACHITTQTIAYAFYFSTRVTGKTRGRIDYYLKLQLYLRKIRNALKRFSK